MSSSTDSPSRFRALFRRRSGKNSQGDNLKFVDQDPEAPKRKSFLGSRVSKSDSKAAKASQTTTELTPSQRRRKQVYDAQKRHRDRHAEYVKNLEAEVARLQHLDAVINSEKNALAHQNNAIREFLASQSLETHLDTMNIGLDVPALDDLSQLGGVAIDYRMDEDIGEERWFLDSPEWTWGSSYVSSADAAETPQQHPVPHEPNAGDSWAALDFIMALEWPCRLHIHHQAISPNATVPAGDEEDQYHGHALTATQAVFQSACAPPVLLNGKNIEAVDYNITGGLHPSTADNWVLPHSEIDKLIELATHLDIDPEYMTPAQMYAVVRETVPNEKYIRPTLEGLKGPLGKAVSCNGFGAGADAAIFWSQFDTVIQNLQQNRPDLG